MLWVLSILLFMFYMACGCVVEERIALMHVISSFPEVGSDLPDSWGRSDDCCSWERVKCNNGTRVSGLDLSTVYQSRTLSGLMWNLDLTVFSSFHELEQLDLYWNSASLQNFDGLLGLTKLRYLNLSDNFFIGNNILESLGKMASLEAINLDISGLRGALPSTVLSRTLKNLREFHLGSNQLNGSIPAFLFELPHLEYLDLSGNHLQGHIPICSTSNLSSSLRTLKISANNLNGTFDFFWLRNCTKLNHVELSSNTDLAVDVKFRGSVPPFQLRVLMLSECNLDNTIIAGPNFLGTQHHLKVLDLSNNNLTGSIPNWILANQMNLVYLNLANNLLVGSLDLMWQYQSNLGMIDISMNRFTGQLPTNISSVFPNLEVLNTSFNIIAGHLPPSLCRMNLSFVDLSNNKLTGEVPACLFTECSTLIMLKLSNNNLGGPILGGASNLSIVEEIHLAGNNFDGVLPNNLSGNKLRILDLHDNKLSGKLDASFWNLSLLQVFSVASNSLTDGIDPAICKLTGLEFLDMSDNNFTGYLPNCSNKKLTLHFLNMSCNTLSGFAGAFLNSSFVRALDLRYNQFEGSLDWIQHLSEIKLLLLGGNIFEGQISPNLCYLQNLNIIDLSHNQGSQFRPEFSGIPGIPLSGSLPRCIGGISFGYHEDGWFSTYTFSIGMLIYKDMGYDNMEYTHISIYDLQGFTFSTKGKLYTYSHGFFNLMFGIDLSGNMLSGEIPWEIGNLSHVKSLNLSHNFFTGRIPATIANMSAIESLDLSHNELSGSIPWQLTQLWSLEVLSVAYNNLSGCIPNSGQFGSFSAESYTGNSNLHNLSQGNGCSPVPGSGEVDDVAEACDDPVLYIISAASFVLAFWATVAFMFCHSFGQGVVLKL
ncbi:unnamed protein product [Urochloa decumbens]|uniref:Leucine-rich repeat-containing N-terminal plant-type domain-containing protein n=1 Tax=Urochloa decumbens TaxID=240449 RepID=A0ABC8VWW1_9POAL